MLKPPSQLLNDPADLPVQDTVKRPAVTIRSVTLGLFIGLLVVVITPYNDFVVDNSFIIGSYFPPIIALAMLSIVLLINGPLHRFLPRWALTAPELSMVLAIGLISCSLPSQGLFRMLLPTMVAPVAMARQEAGYLPILSEMNLPHWLFAASSLEGASELSVHAFYNRLTQGQSIPWGAWGPPLLGWGLFAAAFMTSLIAIAGLVRYQWAVNERLPFPIAQLQSMLVADPPPGRSFNSLFSSPLFWIAAGVVFVIESSLALNQYIPRVPAIPFSYDLAGILNNEPYVDLPGWLKSSQIYFTLLGLVYFTQTKVSFSLWGGAVLLALLRWPFAIKQADLPNNAYFDQQLGASFAFVGGILWIGRHHWGVVWRALIGRARPRDAAGAFAGYRTLALLLIGGIVVMFGWLLVVGCAWPWAIVIILMILMAHVITARVVAETGLAFIRVQVGMDQIITALPPTLLSPRDMFIYGAAHYNFMQSARESTLGFALHGMSVIQTADATDKRRVLPWLGISLLITAIAGVIAALWCYYNYATPIGDSQLNVLNIWGLQNWPKRFLVDLPTSVSRGSYAARTYSPFIQIFIGIAIMVALQSLTWRFSAWPLLPVGYLMCTSWYVTSVWFSLFLGWAAKSLILRFGGAKVFTDLKPFFVGLIFGEAIAVGIWLIVNLYIGTTGGEMHITRFLPQ